MNEAVNKELRIEEEVCPSCGLKGGCHPYGSYNRYLIDFKDYSPSTQSIRITKVICECGHTHAILSDPIVPYLQYSLFYIIIVLAVYSCHLMTVERPCKEYFISPSILYRWLGVYNDNRREWQGLLKSTISDVRHYLYEMVHKEKFSSCL